MSKVNIPYEEKRFMMEFLNIWNRYGKPPITLHTDNLQSTDRGSGKIIGLQHRFVDEVLEVADILQVNVQLECLGIRGSWGTPATVAVMEADGDEEEEDAPTDYAAEDQDEEEADAPTDYSAQNDNEEEDAPTDYGAENDAAEDEETEGEEEGQPEEDDNAGNEGGEEAGTDDAGGDTGAAEEDAPTDYSAEVGGDEGMGEEGGDSESGDNTDTESDDTSSSDEQTDSSNINTLVKNFSLMGDFESLYALITDSINTLNSTLKADPGQNRVLVQVSRNLSSIKDFILTFVQFHFKNDNYQYNLYYYEVVIHLLKLNLAMLEKALTLGESKQEKESKEVNKDG